MNDLHKDIAIGAVFLLGLIGFISGEFIISSTLFAAATIGSNINLNRKRSEAEQQPCDWFFRLNSLIKRLGSFQGCYALEVFLLHYNARCAKCNKPHVSRWCFRRWVGKNYPWATELRQNELAELTGIPQSTISAIEHDKINLSIERSV